LRTETCPRQKLKRKRVVEFKLCTYLGKVVHAHRGRVKSSFARKKKIGRWGPVRQGERE